MNSTGDWSRGGDPQLNARVATAAEKLVEAIRAHADAVAGADESGARSARVMIGSAKGKYSLAIDDAWYPVPPYPLPQTLREHPVLAPSEAHLRVSYQLQVLDKDRLVDSAQEVSCEPVVDPAEAVAALYGAQMWEPSEDTGLVCVVSGYGGGFKQT